MESWQARWGEGYGGRAGGGEDQVQAGQDGMKLSPWIRLWRNLPLPLQQYSNAHKLHPATSNGQTDWPFPLIVILLCFLMYKSLVKHLSIVGRIFTVNVLLTIVIFLKNKMRN